MKSLKVNSLIFLLSFLANAFAEDAKVPCRYKDGSLGLNTLESFDCKLANKISSQDNIKEEYKDYIDKKLASYVARQASDVIEDLALLDSYFEQNYIDLGNNENVKKSCKLEKIADVKCAKNTDKEKIQKKLSYILGADKYLPRDLKDKGNNNNLYKRMLQKALDARSVNKIKDLNKCPVEGNSGHFTLNSQFTSADARTLIIFIKKGEKNNAALAKMYESYPQLKMLVSGKDDALKKKFESAMALYSGENSEKKFVDDFFKDSKNQEQMAKSVSIKCDELEKNIEKFVCVDDYPHLAMSEDDRDFIFEGDDEDKIFKEVSRGLSCKMEAEQRDTFEVDPLTAENTIHQKLDYYLKNVKEERNPTEVAEQVGPFCNLFLCKNDSHKVEFESCKNGGPISSLDVIKTCPEGLAQKCEPKIQKYISYISTLERDAFNAGVGTTALAFNTSDRQNDGAAAKPKGFSSFYQNFLGVEGTIAAEGKKITPITIAEKKAEFAEKKLDVPAAPNLTAQNQSRDSGRVEAHQESISSPSLGQLSANSSKDESEQYRKSFNSNPQFATKSFNAIEGPSSKSIQKEKRYNAIDADSQNLDEMKKLRQELQDAIGKVKGTEEEKLAAVADNNASIIAPKNSAKERDSSRGLNQAEKDRLDSYRDSLNSWESKLRTWQGQLSDRDVRANSGNSSGPSADEPVKNTNAGNFGEQHNSSGAKLTKTTLGGAAAVGTGKADGVSERASGTENVEGEAGVVNSENMASLHQGSLEKLGIVVSDSFIIKVRHHDKIYAVPVKTFNHAGKNMYVPLLNEKNRELSKIVYESPLFKDYRDYQLERQYKLDKK